MDAAALADQARKALRGLEDEKLQEEMQKMGRYLESLHLRDID